MTVIVEGALPWKPRHQTPEREKFLRDNTFLDVSILAHEVGLSYQYTAAIMRRLGLRKCRNQRNKDVI
jgi:hypothetical protein